MAFWSSGLVLRNRPGAAPPPSDPPPPSEHAPAIGPAPATITAIPKPPASAPEQSTNAEPQATVTAEALPTFSLRETGIWIHTFPGANDDERLSAAIAEQRRSAAVENMPPMILPYRTFSVNPVAYRRTLYNGLKLIGPAQEWAEEPGVGGRQPGRL